MGKTQKIGALGEELVAKFLMKQGFVIEDRNFRKKWGELDVIAKKKNVLHFIEVKSVSRNFYNAFSYSSYGIKKSLPGSPGSAEAIGVTRETFTEIRDFDNNKVTRETFLGGNESTSKVTRETSAMRQTLQYSKNTKDAYRPEDNIHPMKIARLRRAIQSYLLCGRVSSETKWQFDVASVFIDKENKKVKIDFSEDVIL